MAKKHKGKHHHTGKLERGTGHIHSHVGHDKMVHADHHKHNKAHGMHHGFAPPSGGGTMHGEGSAHYSGSEGQGVDVPGVENNEECD